MYGKVLRVNLSQSKVRVDELYEHLVIRYVGGCGLATKILYDELPPKINPLSPDNKLVFAVGPLTGTPAPSAGRYSVCAKSPLTGVWGEASSAGFFGPELRFAGYAALIVVGRSEKPVYLWIYDDEVEIRDAVGLWGNDVYETTDRILEELGDKKIKVACIGPAGEKLVKIAAVMNDKDRAAARSGMGCVMGSKNLKAIAIRGTKKPHIADPELFREITKDVIEAAKKRPGLDELRKYGTAAGMEWESECANVPTKYFKEGIFEEADKISGTAMASTILIKSVTCYGCLIACGRYVEVKTGPYAGVRGGGPEYETLAAFGSLCLNDNLESIAKANELCNRLGLDTISTGNVIAFAMECYERGWITKEETDGIDLAWGNHEAIVSMTKKIGLRGGFGDTLAEGVRNAAKVIGKSSETVAMHVKGLEIPMHDPRSYKAMGLNYATSNRGACHMRAFTHYVEMYRRGIPELNMHPEDFDPHSTEGKAMLTRTLQDLYAVYDSLVVCKFGYSPGNPLIQVSQIAGMLSAVLGVKINTNELLRIGERIWNLQRLFNVREGITKKDDTLPMRFLTEPHSKGPSKGQIVELKPMLEEYYEIRGWDENGVPTKGKLAELGLTKCARRRASKSANSSRNSIPCWPMDL